MKHEEYSLPNNCAGIIYRVMAENKDLFLIVVLVELE